MAAEKEFSRLKSLIDDADNERDQLQEQHEELIKKYRSHVSQCCFNIASHFSGGHLSLPWAEILMNIRWKSIVLTTGRYIDEHSVH